MQAVSLSAERQIISPGNASLTGFAVAMLQQSIVSPEGLVSVTRKGWIQRGPIITQLERKGVCGDVTVCYLENEQIKRTVACGI